MRYITLSCAFLSVFMLSVGASAMPMSHSSRSAAEASVAPMCFSDTVCEEGSGGDTGDYAIANCLKKLEQTLGIVVEIWEQSGHTVTYLGSSIEDPDCENWDCTVKCCQTLGICDPQ